MGQFGSVLSDLMQDKPPSGPCTHCGVILVSEGQLGGYASEPDSSSFGQVLSDLGQLGVNPDTFARAVNSQGTYSMLSANGIGYAASSVLATGVSDPNQQLQVYSGTLSGNLARGAAGQLYPLSGDPTGLTAASVLLPIVYGSQGQWAMTPTPSNVVDCPGGPVPPQTGCVASCPATAFAYLVEQAFPDLFSGEVPTLWGSGSSGDAAAGCGGQSGSPDVDPSAVLTAETALRNTYPDYSISLSQALVLAVQMPSGAPFSSSDFTSAQQQMVSELSQRQQVITTMSTAADVQTNSQTNVSIDLAQVASNVQTAELSSIASQIQPQPENDTSWWISLAFHWSNGINKVLNFYRQISPFLNSAYLWSGLLGDGSLAIFDTIEGPGNANPAQAVEEYVLLESQLQQQDIDVEQQIANSLTAQANGMQQTEEILLTSPTMMSSFNQAALTSWNFGANTANVYTSAQNAYLYRVTQLAYEGMWAQAYSATRFNWSTACQYAGTGSYQQTWCWSPSSNEWVVKGGYGPYQSVSSLTGASDPHTGCAYPTYGGVFGPFPGANTGDGLGEGTEYQTEDTVATSGQTPGYLDFVMVESAGLTASNLYNGPPSVASYALVQQFFQQPTDSVGDPSSSSPPGFYAPDFWQQNLPVSTDIQCGPGGRNYAPKNMTAQTVSGYYGNLQSTDLWPTPANQQ